MRLMQPRLTWAFAASIVLHGLLLLPADWLLPPQEQEKAEESLLATLRLPPQELAHELATKIDQTPPTSPPPTADQTQGKLPSPPQELSGQELNTALAALVSEDLYPLQAIEQGIEGRVVLLLLLDEAGLLQQVELASGSGHAILDAAALRAARRIGALPGGRRQVLLPVEFTLE